MSFLRVDYWLVDFLYVKLIASVFYENSAFKSQNRKICNYFPQNRQFPNRFFGYFTKQLKFQ